MLYQHEAMVMALEILLIIVLKLPEPRNQEDSDGDGIGDVCDLLAACDNGLADIYPCNGYDLMSYMSLDDLTPGTGGGSLSGNDSWGWTDPTTNKEYALVGLNSHAAFVDISIPVAPVLVGNSSQQPP